ncbi:MAG TPA: sigma-70 family RNA polymerase sigma factor [Geothrix sp.]
MAEGIFSLPEEPAEDPLDAIVLRLRSGEVEAFAELVALTERRVLSVAWRILGDRHLAEDAAQETYLRVFRSLHRFRLGEPFEAWLIRIAVHVCYDLGRKRGPLLLPMDTLETLVGNAAPMVAEEAVLLHQRRALVRQALTSLPQAERAALVLRDLEGLSTEETARILGVRPVTIRTQVSSARAKVRAFCNRLMKPTHGGRP